MVQDTGMYTYSMSKCTYSISQIHSMIFRGHATFTVPDSVLQILRVLDESIVVPVESTTITPHDSTTTNQYHHIKSNPTNRRNNDRMGDRRNGNNNNRVNGGRPPQSQSNSQQQQQQQQQHRSSKPDQESDRDWNAQKPVFKATKFDQIKEGVDKDINDIRILLNKLSNKKYDSQKTEILTLIQNIFSKIEDTTACGKIETSTEVDASCKIEDTTACGKIEDTTACGKIEDTTACSKIEPESDTQESVFEDTNEVVSHEVVSHEAVQKIGQFIFDIASTNQFFSELYAGLYQDLVAQHAVFSEILEVFVENFQSTLDAVPYCDPATDYDGYCQYTKHNERRRATAAFFVMLVVRGVLSGTRLAALVTHIQLLMETAIVEVDRTNEVEELTEVLFLLITLGATSLQADDSHCWTTTIVPTLQTMSQRKSKDFASLSSRAVFKHRDILDKLAKLT